MDNAPVCYSANLGKVSTDLNKIVNVRSSDCAVPVLGLESPFAVNTYFSRESKRKRGMLDGSSLSLGLGHSSSSCTTMSSGKEMEEESSIRRLGLSIDLHLGNQRTHYTNQNLFGNAKVCEVRRPEVDLELSLSTGPAESDITTVTQGSSPRDNNLDAPALVTTSQLVDEGSTSSRWKCGPLVHPLQSLGSSTLGDPNSHCNPTTLNPNISSALLATPKSSIFCASGAGHQSQQRTNVKICTFEGCIRGARGASGLCIAHGGGRRCQRAGCQKGAEGKTVFCKAHGGGRRCQHLGCTKSAEGRTDFCIGHGGGRRCNHNGCSRAARGKSGLCIRHGGGKRCKMENCTKSAEGISGLCISHGGGRRCQYPACTKGAQGSTMFCKAHGGGKRCTYLGCTKGAEGSTPFCKGHGGGKRCTIEGCTKSVHGGTLFCVSHGGGKRCFMPGCTKSARGRTNFCVRHGGGKRCRYEGCTKSAQGSTNFCKAHGGGKRCSWGQVGSEFGGQAIVPCDKFARGKSGLCAAHTAQLQEKLVQGDRVMASIVDNPLSSTTKRMKEMFVLSSGTDTRSGGISIGLSNHGRRHACSQMPPQDNLDEFSLPEGRVHGGSLMATLRGSTSFQTGNGTVHDGEVETGKTHPVSHSWV